MYLFKLGVLAEYLIALKLLVEFLPLQVLLNLLLVSVRHNTATLRRNKEEVESEEGRKKDN